MNLIFIGKKKHFQRKYFRIYADFGADNEKHNSSVGDKTTNVYKQNPVLNRYEIISELEEENIESDKVRDHCHLTGNYSGPAHSKCDINVTHDKSNFLPFVFHNLGDCDCHMFSKKLVDLKNDKLKIKNIPKTNEEYISIKNGCIRFTDSNCFLSSSLDSLVKKLVDNSPKTSNSLREEIVHNDEILNNVIEIKLLIEEEKYNSFSSKDFFEKNSSR